MTRPIDERIAELERKIERLDDIEAIKRLRWRYSRACDDDNNVDLLLPMFTEDAEVVLNPPFSGAHKGHAALEAMYRDNARVNGVRWTTHYYLQPLINVSGDGQTAEASWYLWEPATMDFPDASNEGVWLAGEYFDRYCKIDGEWKFTRIEINIRLMASYDKGWADGPIRGAQR
ncbi:MULTISPECIES: nuclear transport factor 2 family protein [unclassified Sphingomonas]|uniref:nuclear transport factor 2 family protein n=1 Tax=unclassified Sphingomonas TaxID=196159 RepID=UPI00027CBBB3|nr:MULTISPECIES: nuclear transport factor 2 family protein [unclassified Sphingomonas]EJU15012.1 hypothetical protein LH128_00787 [Sphingomonas sp. LH128]QDK35586.1 nuclear transport factor 2 family protein [Sphingomonas sp. IC081]